MTEDMRHDPVEDGALEATDAERIAGIVEQVRADLVLGMQFDAEGLLRRRLDDAAVVVSDDQFVALLAQVNE
ncbi:MAG: hypothetical protein ABIW36_04095 [Terrimesophilobacter sp.]